MIICDMIFEIEHTFGKIPVEVLERKVINIMDLLAEKTLSVTLTISTAVMKFELAARHY